MDVFTGRKNRDRAAQENQDGGGDPDLPVCSWIELPLRIESGFSKKQRHAADCRQQKTGQEKDRADALDEGSLMLISSSRV